MPGEIVVAVPVPAVLVVPALTVAIFALIRGLLDILPL